MEKTTSVTDLEIGRIYRNINIKCEIVADPKGKRGLRVLEARGGRVGMTIWDDSGNWENIRQRLEEEVWGGLTKQEQYKLADERSIKLTSPQHAMSWAWEFSQNNGDFFADAMHVKNAYEKLKEILKEQMGDELTAPIMFEGWKQEVFRREAEKLAED